MAHRRLAGGARRRFAVLVAGYNVVVAVISLVCARLLPETQGRDLDEAWVAAPERDEEPVRV